LRQELANNSNDSNQARLINFRGNYRPGMGDSIDLQFGFNHDIQGVGFRDKNPTPSNPTSTNGDTFHDLIANSSFVQAGWTHQLENASELGLRYYHVQENQNEAFPVYLNGVFFPGPVVQTLATGRDQIEIQHALSTSDSNRVVYGAHYQRNSVNGQSLLQPLTLHYSSSLTSDNFQIFAHDEFRIAPQIIFNVGGMYEKDDYKDKRLSPRASLNYHLSPQDTFRVGVSVAYRTPSLAEMNYPVIQPGALIIPSATETSSGLSPEKLVSHEVGYIGDFPAVNAVLDLRIFHDQLNNGIFINTVRRVFVNELSAEYHGFEITMNKAWDKNNKLVVNLSHVSASSNGPALVAAGDPYLKSEDPLNSDFLSASIPKNSASILYSLQLNNDYSFSSAYYYQASLQPSDRGAADFQPTQRRVDVRFAKQFQDIGGMKSELALVVQDLFNTPYTEYIASNQFRQRAFVTITLH
jgi:iron complex outermembrane receptor protein